MNNGHEFKLPSGGDVRVRRCKEDVKTIYLNAVEPTTRDVVEFTIETFTPYWSLTSLLLSPAEAALYGSALIAEATKELVDG